ncbi:hypothetical protein [Saccharopolyspora sp. 6V]|uniref:hypothetical protein n=1 Tax=Saccharopolyspora sp. 6V TaxID=2877239 RepID=UPI001CD64929|nr:hypothetical protein [Saccharopolyspora sp. 6V]MCA1191705.1 hypothetical protein [Saccharopolyspora sp. 6V]
MTWQDAASADVHHVDDPHYAEGCDNCGEPAVHEVSWEPVSTQFGLLRACDDCLEFAFREAVTDNDEIGRDRIHHTIHRFRGAMPHALLEAA